MAHRDSCLLVVVVSAGLGLLGAGPAAAQGSHSAAAVLPLADGVRAFLDGRLEEARAKFAEALERDPGDGTTLYWLGLTDLRLQRTMEAVHEISGSLRARTAPQVDRMWVLHDLGQAQLVAGEPAQAEQILREVAAAAEERVEKGAADVRWLQGFLAETDVAPPPEASRAVRRLGKRAATARRKNDTAALDDVSLEARDLLSQREEDLRLLRRALLRRAAALDSLSRQDEAVAARDRVAALGPEPDDAAVVPPPWNGALESPGVPSWEGAVGLAAVDDSNPGQLAESLTLETPTDRTPVSGGESATGSSLDTRWSAYPFHASGDWTLGGAVDGRQVVYRDLGFFDTGELRGAIHAAYGRAPLGFLTGPLGTARVPVGSSRLAFLLQGGGGKLWLDQGSYLRTWEGSASLIFRPSGLLASQADLHVLDRSYAEEPAAGRRSGSEIRLRLSQTFSLRRDDRFLRLEALAGQRSAGRPFAGSLLRGGAEIALPFPRPRLSFSLLGWFQRDSFDHRDSDLFFRPFDPFDPQFGPLEERPKLRRDSTWLGVATLSWAARPRALVTARLAWVDRSSNLGLPDSPGELDYRRAITSLGLTWSF